MTDRDRYHIAVDARLCGARNGSIIVLHDGSRWRLQGMSVVRVDVPKTGDPA